MKIKNGERGNGEWWKMVGAQRTKCEQRVSVFILRAFQRSVNGGSSHGKEAPNHANRCELRLSRVINDHDDAISGACLVIRLVDVSNGAEFWLHHFEPVK